MKKITSLLLVVCLVLTGLWVQPVVGGNEDEQNDVNQLHTETENVRSSRGNTLYVGPGQTYSKIQDAIDNASSGDTIRVWSGIYRENIVVDKTLTITGNGSGKSIIDGEFNGIVMLIKGDYCNISGFSIKSIIFKHSKQ